MFFLWAVACSPHPGSALGSTVTGSAGTVSSTTSGSPDASLSPDAVGTSPGAALDETPFRFAIIGDYGEDGPDEAAVAAMVAGWNPDWVVTTGDNNYPSGSALTIDPNIGVIAVPDKRLEELTRIVPTKKVVLTTVEIVDIAGIVKGASQGEGLGNQFLSHIAEVDAVIQVVRCFEDKDIVHVNGSVDPVRDMEIIKTELILKDLEILSKHKARVEKAAKAGDKKGQSVLALLDRFEVQGF